MALIETRQCRQNDVKVADLCGLVKVVVVLGEEVDALDGVWEVLLKVLSIHTWPHTAQVPVPCNTYNMSGRGFPHIHYLFFGSRLLA